MPHRLILDGAFVFEDLVPEERAGEVLYAGTVQPHNARLLAALARSFEKSVPT